MFEVVYADPPWEFTNRKTGGSHTSGASQKYPTLDLVTLQRLAVPAITAPNASLFLWVPSRLKFSHGYRLAIAWGFPDYQATLYWGKERLGMGFWFRGMVEEVLVFTRGSVRPYRCQRPNLVNCPRDEHSEKPEEFRRIIEDATGLAASRRNLELFGRRKVPGWTVLGNEVTGNDIRVDLLRLATQKTADDDGGTGLPDPLVSVR